MTRTRDAAGAPLPYAPAEAQFNRRRATVGLIVGPVLFLALLLAPAELPPAARKLAAAMGLMIVLWITEALPLAITALVGPMLAVLLGVAPVSTVFAPFAVFYLRQPLKLDYLWAALCLLGAVYFVFRAGPAGG